MHCRSQLEASQSGFSLRSPSLLSPSDHLSPGEGEREDRAIVCLGLQQFLWLNIGKTKPIIRLGLSGLVILKFRV